jgi:hypothetical protein
MEDQQFGIEGFGQVYRKIERLAGLCRTIVRDEDFSNHVILLRLRCEMVLDSSIANARLRASLRNETLAKETIGCRVCSPVARAAHWQYPSIKVQCTRTFNHIQRR